MEIVDMAERPLLRGPDANGGEADPAVALDRVEARLDRQRQDLGVRVTRITALAGLVGPDEQERVRQLLVDLGLDSDVGPAGPSQEVHQ